MEGAASHPPDRAIFQPLIFSTIMRLMLLASAVALSSQAGYTPDPSGVPLEFICAYREYAAEYAARLITRPFDHKIVFDALMLGSLCNKTFAHPQNMLSAASEETTDLFVRGGSTIFVTLDGSDSNPGTKEQPVKTIGQALLLTRKIVALDKQIAIGAGTYYLGSTIELTDEDQGLVITTTSGQSDVWLSGAQPLPTELTWEKYKVEPSSLALNELIGTNNQHGCKPDDSSNPGGCQCYNSSSYGASADQCFNFCKSLGPDGCQSYAHSPPATNVWGLQCCIRRTDTTWNKDTGPDAKAHTSGN
jgi:hypothetical protein